MSEAFPHLIPAREIMFNVLQNEESAFLQSFLKGFRLLEAEMASPAVAKSKKISKQAAFQLYDSLGFPLDITQMVAKDSGFSVDVEGFNQLMADQQK